MPDFSIDARRSSSFAWSKCFRVLSGDSLSKSRLISKKLGVAPFAMTVSYGTPFFFGRTAGVVGSDSTAVAI